MMPIPQCVGISGGFPDGPRHPALSGMIPAQSIPRVSDHPCRDGLMSGMVPCLRFGYNKSIRT